MVSGAYDFKQRDHSTLGLLSAGLEFKQRDHSTLGLLSAGLEFKQRDHSTLGLLSAGLEFKQHDHCQLGAYMNEFDTLLEPPVVSKSFRMKLPQCRRDVCNPIKNPDAWASGFF